LYSKISFIPQNPLIFKRSIKENILYGNLNASMEEIINAAKKASIHDFIISLKDGYESIIGINGFELSGGQKQRIIIARAFLKNSPILILDEATSSLDSLTERKIQESLNLLMTGKTVITIAHRLSTIINMDRILVFENGNIVQDGSHKELILENGLYKKLWDTQINVFLADKNDLTI
jgi:ATP-binding cassette subfamily B protein